MSLLIDGYNLLNGVGILGPDVAPGGLERSRLALLNFLAASIEPEEIPRTTVVFDARQAPPGLPRAATHRGLHVQFAPRGEEADTLIEQLIREDSAPRRLTVVSSDHRLQRAARRRRARAVDSDVWYAEVVRGRRRRREAAEPAPERPAVPLLQEDVEYWVRQFGGESLLKQMEAAERAAEAKPAPRRDDNASAEAETAHMQPPRDDELGTIDNPFPPGYGEDLLADMP